MKKQLQGIALILFFFFLSADLPFGFLGVIIGIVGLIFVFKEVNDKNS